MTQVTADTPRDARGRFISKNAPPQDVAETTLKTTGPLKTLSKKPDPPFDEPLISFSIQNPFKRVLVTGLYDKIANTLKVGKASDIEVLP